MKRYVGTINEKFGLFERDYTFLFTVEKEGELKKTITTIAENLRPDSEFEEHEEVYWFDSNFHSEVFDIKELTRSEYQTMKKYIPEEKVVE